MLKERSVASQRELVDALAAAGCPVTQATISRDLRELGLQKGRDAVGRIRYVFVPASEERPDPLTACSRMLKEFGRGIQVAQNLLVVRCDPGAAPGHRPGDRRTRPRGHPGLRGRGRHGDRREQRLAVGRGRLRVSNRTGRLKLMAKERCVLAYSGGLDTSALVPYMKEKYGYEIICALVDVGRMKDLESLRQRGLTAGAVESVVIDAKEEFLTDFAFEALKANALYEGKYPLHSALSRPLISKKMVELAHECGRQVHRPRLHGQGQRPGAHRRVHPLPRPVHHRAGPGPGVGHDPAGAARLPGRAGHRPAAHQEEPLLHRREPLGPRHRVRRAGGPLGAPLRPTPTSSPSIPRMLPTRPRRSSSASRPGIPVSLDGKKMGPVELVETIDKIGGAHGFGRVDMVENRLVGIKSREIYEVAGSLSLIKAHRELEDLTLTRELQHFKTGHRPAPDRADLRRSVVQPAGRLPARLHRREPEVRDRRCPPAVLQGLLQLGRAALAQLALRTRKLATYGSGDTFSHESAKGFIQLWGLPVEVWARKHQGQSELRPDR